MRNYDRIKENLIRTHKGLSSLKKKMPLYEYLEDRYLIKQVCITSIALACLNEGIDEFLAFQLSLNEKDRLLLSSLTGER